VRGIYGIMAYSVANRKNEIGIRMALGAQPGQVRGMILRESTWIAARASLPGLLAAVALTRLVKSMLYGIQPNDPATLGGGVLILLAVALAASWIPPGVLRACSRWMRCGTNKARNERSEDRDKDRCLVMPRPRSGDDGQGRHGALLFGFAHHSIEIAEDIATATV